MSDSLFELCSVLERFFSSPVGANAYYTPRGSQGFAPHYDDIDACVCQTHGRKRWRLYPPRSHAEASPRFSSPNFRPDDLPECALEVVLEQGDFLFLPRGVIHEAFSLPGDDSLHVTLSTSQHTTWADLLERAMPQALRLASEELPALRSTLPRRLFAALGVAHSDGRGQRRRRALAFAQALLSRVIRLAPLDAAADQMAADFQRTRCPPPARERPAAVAVGAACRVRLAFAGCATLCVEGDEAVVHHPFSNRREAAMMAEDGGDGEEDGSALAFPLDAAPMLEALILAHPRWLTVAELPVPDGLAGLEILQALVAAGVLVALNE
jgi:lysine-specific demethylase/histidyl-hydroxylase NO66